MEISEQVKELRKAARWLEGACFPEAVKLIDEAADTIESLSAKLQAANMERTADFENCGSGCLHWDSIYGGCTVHNTVPEGCKDFCSIQKSNDLTEDFGGWILCKDRLPTMEEYQKMIAGLS